MGASAMVDGNKAFVAQWIEHLTSDQTVGSSSLSERASIPPGSEPKLTVSAHMSSSNGDIHGDISSSEHPDTARNTPTQTLSFTVTFGDFSSDVLAVGKPVIGGLEIVLDQKSPTCSAEVSDHWRDRAFAGVARHLIDMMVVAEECGSGHEIEPFVITEACAYVESTIHHLNQCLGVVGEAGL